MTRAEREQLGLYDVEAVRACERDAVLDLNRIARDATWDVAVGRYVRRS